MTNDTAAFRTHQALKSEERKARTRANYALTTLTMNRYFDSLPIAEIIGILEKENFNVESLRGVYCGKTGHSYDQVGPITYFSLSWHQMGSGRYEVLAYLHS